MIITSWNFLSMAIFSASWYLESTDTRRCRRRVSNTSKTEGPVQKRKRKFININIFSRSIIWFSLGMLTTKSHDVTKEQLKNIVLGFPKTMQINSYPHPHLKSILFSNYFIHICIYMTKY